MKRIRPAVVVAWLLLIGTGILTQAFLFRQEVQGHTRYTQEIPARLGPWSAIEDIPATESEIRGLETQDILRRVYSNGNQYIELVVAYIARSTRKSAHAQEACLRGAGAQVGLIDDQNFPDLGIHGKRIRLEYNRRTQWVLYFYKIGDTYTADYLKSSWLMFFKGWSGDQNRGSALIRLLTPEAPGESPEEANRRIEDFLGYLKDPIHSTLP